MFLCKKKKWSEDCVQVKCDSAFTLPTQEVSCIQDNGFMSYCLNNNLKSKWHGFICLIFCVICFENVLAMLLILMWFKKETNYRSVLIRLSFTDFHIHTQGDFSGKCLLYGSVRFNGSEIDVSWSSTSSLCYFVSGISLCVAVFCFSTTLYWVYTSCVDGEVKRWEIALKCHIKIYRSNVSLRYLKPFFCNESKVLVVWVV